MFNGFIYEKNFTQPTKTVVICKLTDDAKQELEPEDKLIEKDRNVDKVKESSTKEERK